jgi:hypothetical protein
MIQGSCLCGGVRFEIDERHILIINNCYCTNCRRYLGLPSGPLSRFRVSTFDGLRERSLCRRMSHRQASIERFAESVGRVRRNPRIGQKWWVFPRVAWMVIRWRGRR